MTAGLALQGVPALADSARSSSQATAAPPTIAQCLARFGSTCLSPQLLRQAYGVDKLIANGITGEGVTIGIVDSFGSPTLARDLQVFSDAFGLPPADLEIVTPVGPPPPFDPGNSDMVGWAGETALDVQIVHAIAPGAKIIVIVTPTSETEGLQGFPEIVAAEQAMLSRVDVLSQSFAATEPTFASGDDIRRLSNQIYPAAKVAGVAVLSASGDSGPTDLTLDLKTHYARPVTVWPASDPLVTAVGGTQLGVGSTGVRNGPDRGWSGSGAGGGGVSEVFARPAFQTSLGGLTGSGRAVPDISLDAAPATGMLFYGSYAGEVWQPGGGTSQAAPILAGIVALADQLAGKRIGYLNDALYALASAADRGLASGIVDVTQGSNAWSGTRVPGYPATAGYDLATGLGTIDASTFVPAIVAATKGQQQPLARSGASAAGNERQPTTTPDRGATSPGAVRQPSVGRGDHSWPWVYAVGAGLAFVAAVAGGLVLRRHRKGSRSSKKDSLP